jgi:predicted DNA-binding transcriptional regulator YafY
MSINKFALIRYKTIDNCLKNRYRKWTLEDLVEACSDALYEYEGIKKGVSTRTVQLDLQNMRSEKLGYNAPIIVIEKKYYTYEDSGYSITNIPLSNQDLGTLAEVVGVLKQFKGFNYFEELSGMVTRLEDKLYKQKHKGRSYIDFEKNELLKGLEHIDPLHKAILGKRTLLITYQSFKAREASQLLFYPYLLKEYRNRWFLLGSNKKAGLLTLALDRIASFREQPGEKYEHITGLDIETFFNDTIGVSKNKGQKAITVVLRINRQNSPYILTKPLHPSQKILQENTDHLLFSIQVVWNFELERELLGFGEALEVLSPKRLRNKIAHRLKGSLQQYERETPVEKTSRTPQPGENFPL